MTMEMVKLRKHVEKKRKKREGEGDGEMFRLKERIRAGKKIERE